MGAYGRGMGNFVANLVREIAQHPTDQEFIAYVANGDNLLDGALPDWLKTRPLGAANSIWAEQASLPVAAIRDRLDVLHCPANTAPIALPRRIKLVLTIHDVMFMMPECVIPRSSSRYQRLGRSYRRFTVPRAARHACTVVTDSHSSANDISTYLALPSERIRVVYGAAGNRWLGHVSDDEVARARRTHAAGGRFVLALGGVDPRKNTARVIEAFALFNKSTGRCQRLIIAGLPNRAVAEYRACAVRAGIAENVTFLDFISERELAALYHGADVFLYPSLYEGFGLPVLEAMTAGTPVVTSRVGSIPEVARDAAIMVDPLDTRAIADALTRVIDNAGLRHELIARGRCRALCFSWEKATRELISIYEEALQ